MGVRSKNMNSIGPIKSSFLSCEKDLETIVRKLFIESKPYNETLKRLLIINTKDCIDDLTDPAYKEKIDAISIKDLVDKGYIRTAPKIEFGENEEVKSYLIISFDNFTTNKENPEFRDCIVEIDILCHTDYWDVGNFRQRPIKIMGYIDGILNESKLSGIGTLNFIGANELTLSDTLSGYCLMYAAIHGSDDIIPGDDN